MDGTTASEVPETSRYARYEPSKTEDSGNPTHPAMPAMDEFLKSVTRGEGNTKLADIVGFPYLVHGYTRNPLDHNLHPQRRILILNQPGSDVPQ